MLRLQRRESRKIAKLARALAALDEQAAAIRPAPKRATRLSLHPSR
jgi:hypothetical protein